MKIISFLNSKGGVGKTTLCINVAKYLYLWKYRNLQNENYIDIEEKFPRILLVDADPQGSIRDWHEAGAQKEIDIIACDRKQTLLQLPEMLKKSPYDFVLIDTPGKVSDIMGAAISISDLCLLPVQPSPYDLWASQDTVELIKIRQSVSNNKPEARFVLNRAIPNTTIGFEIVKYMMEVEPVLELIGHPIHQRVCYAASAKDGKTIFEVNNDLAQKEIINLGKSILEFFGELNHGI